ncbi:MAG: hypothetical protein F4W94_04660 [Acidimicrobiia bacterium]|nr:hypothetical protein [Acidimicrobiia bacterium]
MIAETARTAAKDAIIELRSFQTDAAGSVTVTKTRNHLRQWLTDSPQGHAVEEAVTRLLNT